MIDMINTKLKKIIILVWVCGLAMSGCGNKEMPAERKTAEDDNKECDYYIYCIDESGMGLTTWGYDVSDKNQSETDIIRELICAFETAPHKNGCTSAKGDKLKTIEFDVADGVVKIEVDRNYMEMDSFEQLFFRASLVLTLAQVEEVSYVYMTVNGQPMTDSQGNVMGYMNGESFALYEDFLKISGMKKYVTLYYANEKGDKLKESRKEYIYDESQSPEMFALMLLKQGPSEEGYYRTIPQDMQIKNVFTKDGICYVNLGNNVNKLMLEVADARVMFYSMVNTLTEIDGVTKVQFMIEGDCGGMLRNEISLDRTYTVNLDIVEK